MVKKKVRLNSQKSVKCINSQKVAKRGVKADCEPRLNEWAEPRMKRR